MAKFLQINIIMKKNILTISFCSLIISMSAFATNNFSTIEVAGTNIEFNAKKSSSYLTLGYRYKDFDIDHFETSNNSQFYNLNKSVNLGGHNLDIGFNKEFLKGNSFSISLLANVDYGVGENKSDLTKDILQEYSYGGGLSLNLNFENSHLRIQPYLSTLMKKNERRVVSNYKVFDADYGVYIENEYSLNKLQYSAGVRFFNQDKSLMSLISINYDNILNSSSKTYTSLLDKEVDLIQNSKIITAPVSVLIGFGFML